MSGWNPMSCKFKNQIHKLDQYGHRLHLIRESRSHPRILFCTFLLAHLLLQPFNPPGSKKFVETNFVPVRVSTTDWWQAARRWWWWAKKRISSDRFQFPYRSREVVVHFLRFCRSNLNAEQLCRHAGLLDFNMDINCTGCSSLSLYKYTK